MLNKITQLMMGVGAAGLFVSFSTLVRGHDGSLFFLVCGAALLAAGAPFYYVTLPTRRASSPRRDPGVSPGVDGDVLPSSSRDDADSAAAAPVRSVPTTEKVWPEQKLRDPHESRFFNALAYILVVALLIACIATTVWVIVTGAAPAVLLLLWTTLGGFGIFIAARQISLRNK